MTDYTELRADADAGKLTILSPSSALALLDELDALRAKKAKPAKSKDAPPGFDEAWSIYPKRPGASRAATLSAWNARINAGASPSEMIFGVRRYAAYCVAERTEPQFIKMPSTFFGPAQHFASDWSIAAPEQSQLGKAGQATKRAADDWLEGAA